MMDQQTSATVARQATFDTDPDRVKIKKGTLKLPVIQAEGDGKSHTSEPKPKTSVKNTADTKSKQTDSTEKQQGPSSKDKRGKDSVNNHRKSDTSSVQPVSDTKDAGLSEKQKKLNALNEARKTNNTKTKEPDDNKKEQSQKTSVLNNLNAKRSNSPEKRQSPPKITDSSEEKSGSKPKQSKKQNNTVGTDESSTKSSKSPQKASRNPPKDESSANSNKNPHKRDTSPQKEAIKDEKQSNNDNKLQATKNGKDLKGKKSPDRSRSPNKRVVANATSEDQKAKDNSSKASVAINKKANGSSNKVSEANIEKSKVVKRDPSPNKQVKGTLKQLSPAESDSLKNLKAKKQLGHSESASTAEPASKAEVTQTIKSEKTPEKKLDNSHKGHKETSDTISNQTKEDKNLTPSGIDILEKVSSQDTNLIFKANKAPAETKLVDTKHSSIANAQHDPIKKEVPNSVFLNDIPDEKEHVDLTAAVALLVSEGAKYSNESGELSNDISERPQSNKIQTTTPSPNIQENTTVSSEINEAVDNLPELRNSKGQKTERIDKPVIADKVSSRDSVRKTYVVSPSPTKLDSPEVIRSELVVEQIGIEAKPKGQKMQGRETYEQIYAERNTLLKAEYTYRKRIKQLEEEANGFLRTIEDLTSENKLLRDRVDHLESKQRHNGDDSAYEKVSVLEKEKGELEGRVKQLEHLANSDANVNESADAMQKEIRELKAQVIKLQTDNQTVNEENIKLKAENYENVKKLHAVEAEASSLAKNATAVESERKDKNQNLSGSAKDKSELTKKNEELKKKVDALEFENNSLSDTLAQKKHELKEIMTVMKDENKYDNEIKDLNNQILKLQQEKKDMERAHSKELRTVTGELQETKARLDDTSKEIYELKIKFDETEKENNSLKEENVNLTKIKQSQEIEIERLKAEIDRLKQALRESKDRYEQVVNDTQSNSSELRTAKENAEELNRDLQKIIADKESQISKLIGQLDASNKDKDFVSQTLKKEKEQLSNENNRLKVFEANMGRMELELKQLVTKYEEAELKNKQLSIQLQDKGFETSNLEQQVFELNMKLDNSSRRISLLDKDKRELEEDRREWEVKKEKVGDIESSNRRLIDENKRLRSQLELTSYSLDYKPPEQERDRPVVEAWVSDTSSKPTQQALYVQKEKKKVTIAPHPTMAKKHVPFSKSKPVRSLKSVPLKKDVPKNSVRSSRSLEDLRKTPDSESSLPELQKETRLTTYGGYGPSGYAQIHKNRVRALHKKVY